MERYPHQPPAVQEHDQNSERHEEGDSVPKMSRLALVSQRRNEMMERVVQRKKRDEQLRKQGYSMIIDTGAAVVGTKARET